MVETSLFRQKAPVIMKELIADFELEDYQAAGILGNLGTECMGFHALHELGQPDGKGGYGWGQWTGPRRKLFFDWCKKKKLDWQSDEANYGYLSHELHTTYSFSISALHKTHTVDDAVIAFERNYEQAGVPNYEDRKKWGRTALDAFRVR